MMRILFASSVLALLATSTQAAHIQEGSIMCVSQKYLDKYENLTRAGEEKFLDEMRKRVQCVEKKKEVKVLELSRVGEHVQVELLDGFRVWVNASSLVE